MTSRALFSPSVPSMNSSSRRLLPLALKATLSIVLLAWLLRQTDIASILAAVQGANPTWIALAASLHGVGLLVSVLRWRLLLRAQGVDAKLRTLAASYLVGFFYGNFLPTSIGGDAVRTYDSWRLGLSKSRAVATIFVDRFLGLLGLALFALFALAAQGGSRDLSGVGLWLIAGTGGALLLLLLLALPSRALNGWTTRLIVVERVLNHPIPRRIVDGFGAFRGERTLLLRAFLLSVLLQVNVVLYYWLLAQALSLPIPLASFFWIIPLVSFILLLPISINAVGVREYAFVFFFAAFAVGTADAVAFAWIAYAINVAQGAIGAVVNALRR